MHWLLGDTRLVGRWRSDRERTATELAARTDIPDDKKRKLSSLFGKLELRYTRWRCYSTFDGTTDWAWYRVVAKDDDSVVLVSRWVIKMEGRSVGSVRNLCHIHFEDDSYYWMTLGSSNVREFFRRVDSA